jgi:hypothetical protein
MDFKANSFLADYLSNRSQRVQVNGTTSDKKRIAKGVPQGSILGPQIFNVFVNDLLKCFEPGHIFNYADDNTVFMAKQSKDDITEELTICSDTILNWCRDNQMEANPTKFQIMIASNSATEVVVDRTANTTIKSEPSVKLLGVTLDENLNFDLHISHLVSKASRQLNCLKRIAYHFDPSLKLLLYKTFILSTFNYCPAVWHLCGLTNTKKLEKVQWRALKFIYNDYNATYEELLSRANLPSLALGRIRAIALEVFRVVKGLSPAYLAGTFTQTSNRYNLRSQSRIIYQCNDTKRNGLDSFRHYGGKIWNALPENVRSETDYKIFRNFLKTWSGPTCSCSFCR